MYIKNLNFPGNRSLSKNLRITTSTFIFSGGLSITYIIMASCFDSMVGRIMDYWSDYWSVMEKPKKYKKPKIYISEVVFPFGVVEIIAIKKKWSRSVIVRTEVVEDNRIIEIQLLPYTGGILKLMEMQRDGLWTWMD